MGGSPLLMIGGEPFLNGRRGSPLLTGEGGALYYWGSPPLMEGGGALSYRGEYSLNGRKVERLLLGGGGCGLPFEAERRHQRKGFVGFMK